MTNLPIPLLRLGTRGSALALAQVDLTRAALGTFWPGLPVEQRVFITRGDKKLDLDLSQEPAGGKGLFTRELEDALLAGAIDVAVHSLKDLPGHNPPGLTIAAVLERASTADVLITREARSFEGLPQGACIGTSSIRRARQLQHLRPDLQIVEWRGNVPTRLRKLANGAPGLGATIAPGGGQAAAGIVLAEAGLARLGMAPVDGVLVFEGTEFRVISLCEHLLPAIGQGAIALQCRQDRAEVLATLAGINHQPSYTCVRAEREVQRLLAGDCALPVGVRAWLADDTLFLEGILFGEATDPPMRAEISGPAQDPEALADALFHQLTRS